jgi:hypothetical protein
MPRPSSVTFWDLMDRWDVSDDQAMELVGCFNDNMVSFYRQDESVAASQGRNRGRD